MPTVPQDHPSVSNFLQLVGRNRPGLVGFGLSLLQLAVHAAWIIFVSTLSATKQAEQLNSGSWQLWIIAALILAGGILTLVSLFLCLYGAIRGTPKTLAIVGLCISFFVGTFTTFALLMNAMGG